MVEFGLAVAVRVEDAIINDPVLVGCGVVVNQIDDADAFDDTVSIAAVVASDTRDLKGVRLIEHGSIEEQITVL